MHAFADHHHALCQLAQKMCGNGADAEDLVQDTFERALRCSEKFTPGTNEGAWLATILRRLFVDAYRRRRSSASVPYLPIAAEQLQVSIDQPEPEPFWASFGASEIGEALARLEEPFQSVFAMYVFEGRSYSEIAARLRIPKATVGTRLVRARKKLRDILCSSARAI